MVSHCAGMVDLVSLPVWVGTLIGSYHFDPQRAGGLVTLYLIGGVLSSLILAPLFARLNGRVVASVGYGVATLAFLALSFMTKFPAMAAGQALAGVAVGAALSVTHGTIARSANPHRLFATVGMALGVFAICFLGATPKLIGLFGGRALFEVFAGVTAVAAIAAAVSFPLADAPRVPRAVGRQPISLGVWAGILGVVCLALVQAMMFSFVVRIGIDRGFGAGRVTLVLVMLSFVNLFPSPLAALMQQRWPARYVLRTAPFVQAALAVVIAQSTGFVPFAVATSLLTAVVIFLQPFVFGVIARLDGSGRALAGTPAMMMIGSAIGPILAGTLVKMEGYGSLGSVALVICAVAALAFWRVRETPGKVAIIGAPLAELSAERQ